MAKMSYEEFTAADNATGKKVGYFKSLKDDGDETLVRFNYKTTKDFDVVSVHQVEAGGKRLSVECLREMYEEKATCKCPLCKQKDGDNAKYPVKIKTYLQMIEYEKDEKGNVSCKPVVWERASGMITDIIGAYNDGISNGLFPAGTDICDVVFKIRRSGKARSSETRFFLTAGNPNIYPEAVYAKDFSGFDGYDAAKHSYWVKSVEEMNRFIETGSFDEPKEEGNDLQEPAPSPANDEVLNARKPVDATPAPEAPNPTPANPPRRITL